MVYDYLLRFIVIGDTKVGKTSICSRMSNSSYTDNVAPTIGIDFTTTVIKSDSGKLVKCQFWDTAGCERFRSITKSYYNNIVAAIIVYDTSNKESFLALTSWLKTLNENRNTDEKIKILLLGNKTDVKPRQVSFGEANVFAKSNNLLYFETSAKLNLGVRDSLKNLVESILGDQEFFQGHSGVKFKTTEQLTLLPRPANSRTECCCNII